MPPSDKLTDTAVRKAKPVAKTVRMFDGKGLYLELTPAGGKLWRLKYRFDGKEKRLSFGSYPEVSLADARQRRDAARKLLAADVDPAEHRKAAKAARAARSANSFELLAREWHGQQSWVHGYSKKVLAWFENDVFPWIGNEPVAGLEAPDFLQVARKIEGRGAIESAHRVLQNCGAVMRYAIATGRARHNPVPDLRGALKASPERHHAAITDPAELGALLRAIDNYRGSFVTLCALRLSPLVFTRPGELRHAEWSEVDFDDALWSIPGEKMKMGQPHIVPLSEQALAILRELEAVTGRGRYAFPGIRTRSGSASERPMSDNTVNAALRRLGYDSSTATAHGFRATARTILDEVLHYRPDYIEHQLAHAVRDPNGRAYNRTAHLAERRKMMQGWADYLDTLKADTGTVVPFRKASGESR
ncbi:tyrosine-type recombinase/integrase [Marilutibacter maris]|uniref:Integrase n=1 Tax=Marilutibacter maris TaxID=1605891 RepID=A0A2U9T400_9GAMM|nr:integrase arm-type DNA-binding domain-containing protein [Lysobacter maris]AWV07221.1 Integrase [Lysobacter maris]